VFEKLLSLLLHAKGGAVATVLVLGASGALVTATVQSGATTVTITQPSAATTGSDTTTGSTTTPNNTVTQTVLALFSRTQAADDPTAPATGNGCSDAAHAMNVQVKAVNETFKTDHQAIEKQRKDAKTDAARKALNDADKVIRETRQAAVKAIHLLFKSDECKGNGDEDKDTEDTEDADNDSTITVAISCTDAKACADAAIKAMNDEVTALTATLSALTTAPTAPKADTKKADTKSDNAKNATKGKGHSEGRSHQGDD
jgi:hypothetical protein